MAKKKAPAGGINKMDAVRQAMAALGNAATRTEIQKFVKDGTGVEMNLDVVSSYKSFVAKESKKSATKTPAAQLVAPKPVAVTTPEAKPVHEQPAVATTPEAMPVLKQPAAATKKKRKKPKRAKASSKPVATIAPAPSVEATGIALNDIQTVKELVKRVGVNTLKSLIDVFGK